MNREGASDVPATGRSIVGGREDRPVPAHGDRYRVGLSCVSSIAEPTWRFMRRCTAACALRSPTLRMQPVAVAGEEKDNYCFLLGALAGGIAVSYLHGDLGNLRERNMSRLRNRAADTVEQAEQVLVRMVQNLSTKARSGLRPEQTHNGERARMNV